MPAPDSPAAVWRKFGLRPALEAAVFGGEIFGVVRAAHTPAAPALAARAGCARIFTHRSDLTLRSAQRHATHGYAAEARVLGETALPFARDEKTRTALTLVVNHPRAKEER